MTVGTFAGMALHDSAHPPGNGAVFLLRNSPAQDAAIQLSGWTIQVAAGVKAVVIYGHSGTGPDGSHTAALAAANNGLDYMSARGLCDVAIRDAFDQCFVWWPDSNGIVLRANVVRTVTSSFTATVTAVDAAGNPIPQVPPPTPTQHDAFRFIRMSRTSEYLFDSYRNMFLAFEAVLSDIRPRKSKTNGHLEGEGEWFKKALRAADQHVPIASLAPTDAASAVEWIYENMYGDERSGLMHAKQGQEYHLPQDEKSRRQLETSLDSLWTYISALVAARLGVSHQSGGIVQGGWELMTRNLFSQIKIVISDDESQRTVDTRFAPTGGSIVELVPGPVVMTEPLLGTVLGTHTLGRGAPKAIRKIGAMDADGVTLAISALCGTLELGTSVKRFEALVGFRNISATGPRTHFSA